MTLCHSLFFFLFYPFPKVCRRLFFTSKSVFSRLPYLSFSPKSAHTPFLFLSQRGFGAPSTPIPSHHNPPRFCVCARALCAFMYVSALDNFLRTQAAKARKHSSHTTQRGGTHTHRGASAGSCSVKSYRTHFSGRRRRRRHRRRFSLIAPNYNNVGDRETKA